MAHLVLGQKVEMPITVRTFYKFFLLLAFINLRPIRAASGVGANVQILFLLPVVTYCHCSTCRWKSNANNFWPAEKFPSSRYIIHHLITDTVFNIMSHDNNNNDNDNDKKYFWHGVDDFPSLYSFADFSRHSRVFILCEK